MIAEFLFKNPRILVLTIATVVVAGLTSLWVLPRLEDPVLGKRVAVVSTVYPGANANQVESLVTIPIEEQLSSIAELKQVRSNSRTGISNIVIELNDAVDDVEDVWSVVRSRLIDLDNLPSSCQKPALEVFPLKAFAAIIAIKPRDRDTPSFGILRRLARDLRTSILGIIGTESVEVFGDPGEELVVEVEPSELASLGLSTAAIARQVSESQSNQPSGSLNAGDEELLLDLTRQSMPVTQVGETLISFGMRGESVRLAEFATIKQGLIEPASSMAIIDGQPAIVLGALVNDDHQIDIWSHQLQSEIEDFEAKYPGEVIIDLLFSQAEHVHDRMITLLRNLAIGTAAVVLIVLLLMGWRSMLVVGAALPLTALLVVVGMRLLAIPIHQMSVTGLIVALGLLIDNAIVMVEEVRSRIVKGVPPALAITGSVQHLAMPLFGSTLTTTLAFLPIATLPGPPGEFVGTIAVSVILAICASFALSMTLIPAMNGLLKIDPAGRGMFSYGLIIPVVQRLYEASLRFVFRFPVIGLLLGLVLPIWGFKAAAGLPQQFFPPSDRQQIQIEVERPARETLEGIRKSVDQIQKIIGENTWVQRQHWFLGGSAPTFYYNVVPRRRGTPFYAQAIIDLRAGHEPGQVAREIQILVDDRVFDSRVIVRQLEQGPPFDAPVEIRLVGPELATLQQLGNELRLLLSETPDVIHTRSDLEETIPKLSLNLDPKKLREAGLSESSLAALLYTTLEGAEAGSVFDGGEELPIVIKMKLDPDSQIDVLGAVQLPSSVRPSKSNVNPSSSIIAGASAPSRFPPQNPTLASVAEFELDSDVGAIVRIDGRRVNEIKAYLQAGVLPSIVLQDFKQRLAKSDFILPAGYLLELGGETEQRSNAVNSLIANSIVLFALILLTLVASFRSFRCAMIVAAVGALSVGLGPLALSLFGYPFGFMAIVGTMGLVGVAINDSIVVLAAIRSCNFIRTYDLSELTRTVSGCTRHVMATTFTTIVGFLPLILGGGGFWPPLAITIAGGVGGATLLALYFVPSLYLLLFHD